MAVKTKQNKKLMGPSDPLAHLNVKAKRSTMACFIGKPALTFMHVGFNALFSTTWSTFNISHLPIRYAFEC